MYVGGGVTLYSTGVLSEGLEYNTSFVFPSIKLLL